MSFFKRSPSEIVAEAMRESDREYEGYSDAIVSLCIRNRHGPLLDRAEQYGGPQERERWHRMIRMFGDIAVRMLEVWIHYRGLVPIPGPAEMADDSPPEADDATRDIL